MKNGDRNLVRDSIADAKKIRELAVEAAKKDLVEQMTPAIRNLVENQIRSSIDLEDTDRLRRAADGYGETEFEEGKELDEGDEEMDKKKKETKEESLSAMFPNIAEIEELDDDEGDLDKENFEGSIPTLEGEGCGEDDEEMDEEITIDEKGLRKAYESIMKSERAINETSVDWSPSVTSGFKDTYPSTEWETEEKKPSQGEALADQEGGEKGWEQAHASNEQDYQVKEAIERGLRENADLRNYVSYLEEQVATAARIIGKLKNEITAVNLFNTKVLHVNEMLTKYKGLTNEQKIGVIEKIDEAKTVEQVKLVVETFKRAFDTVLKEGRSRRRPLSNAGRVNRSGGADQKVLRESVDKKPDKYKRMKELAGLIS